jgi:nicotinamidase-related amidase
MPLIDATDSQLLLVDFQARLMPAIAGGPEAVANARRLAEAARLLAVPILTTEQNPKGLGATVPELQGFGPVVTKTAFGACAEPAFRAALDPARALVVTGCEAHVCVLQTVLGLRAEQRRVYVVADAVGSRAPDNRAAAIARMAAHGAEIVTTEMTIFEWLRDAAHPRFQTARKLVV